MSIKTHRTSDPAKGGIVAILGPSGVGKDSLIAHVQARLAYDPRFKVVRRVITRPGSAGGEDHQPASKWEFAKAVSENAFCVHWQANGHHYGIPKSATDDLDRGHILLVNGSRFALPIFQQTFGPALKTILVTASAETLAHRLAMRARETEAEILARLQRNAKQDVLNVDLVIANDGKLEDAGEAMLAFLMDTFSQAASKRADEAVQSYSV